MHKVLYRKWRPKTFADVCGQNHITDILSYEVANDRLAHAYLFCGSRGTGKTTCAKILAKAVNCQNPVNGEPCGKCPSCLGIDEDSITDVVEMDAASNNGVDDVRRIREEVVYPPSTEKYRVYIIDEVHMLSTSAFNALLKTIEEPPKQVIFILATTEIQKLPTTIVSRCRRFDFRRIPSRIIADRLNHIAKEENIELTDDAALMIARFAEGGMRDAIGMLELASSGGHKVDSKRVEESLGTSGIRSCANIAQALLEKKTDKIFSQVEEIYASSKDINAFWSELVSFYRDMLIVKSMPKENAIRYLDITSEEYTLISMCANSFSVDELYYHSKTLDDAYIQMQKNVVSKRLCAEFALVKITSGKENSISSLAARVAALERSISTGIPASQPIPEVISKAEEKASEEKKEESKPSTPAKVQEQAEEKTEYLFWNEILSSLATSRPTEHSFLRKSEAFFTGDKLEISVIGDFAKLMLDKEDVKNEIISLTREYDVRINKIVFTVKINTEKVIKDDDLLSSLGEV